MVLQLQMFMQGSCVERDKTSGFSFSFKTLFSTWQQTKEYNSEEEKNPVKNRNKYY